MNAEYEKQENMLMKNTKQCVKKLRKTEVDSEIADAEVIEEQVGMEGAGEPQAEEG